MVGPVGRGVWARGIQAPLKGLEVGLVDILYIFFWLAGLVGERNLSFFLNGNGGESCHFLVLIFVGKKLEGLKKERKIKLKFFLRRLWMI